MKNLIITSVIFIICIINTYSQTWSPLGSGMGGYMPFVYTLTIYNGALIAGGDFTTAGGVNANCIAQWNGSTWSPLGSGLGNGGYPATVTTLTVFNDDLIVGGNFSTAGGVSTYYIAKWH